MTTLGRLIFFDQPGTGASDPVTPGALPTLEQWADSITAVLDDLGSREAVLIAPNGGSAPAALFAATHPSRTTALVVLEGYSGTEGLAPEEVRAAVLARWGTGQMQYALNPDMPWNEEIRAAWARHERLAASPAAVTLVLRLATELDVRALLPAIRVPPSSSTTPTTRWSRPLAGGTSLITYRARNTLNYQGATRFTSLNHGGSRSMRSPSSSRVSKQKLPMIGFSPRCCSPTSWTRRAAPRRWVTATGMRCLMRTTPSCGRSLLGFGAGR